MWVWVWGEKEGGVRFTSRSFFYRARLFLFSLQFCMSGDHTLAGTARAIAELGRAIDDHDESFVIVLSDANFDRYGKYSQYNNLWLE